MIYDMSWLDEVPFSNIMEASTSLKDVELLKQKESDIKNKIRPYDVAKSRGCEADYLLRNLSGLNPQNQHDVELYNQLTNIRREIYRSGNDDGLNKFLEKNPDLLDKYPGMKSYIKKLQDISKDPDACRAAVEFIDDFPKTREKLSSMEDEEKSIATQISLKEVEAAGKIVDPRLVEAKAIELSRAEQYNEAARMQATKDVFHGMMMASESDSRGRNYEMEIVQIKNGPAGQALEYDSDLKQKLADLPKDNLTGKVPTSEICNVYRQKEEEILKANGWTEEQCKNLDINRRKERCMGYGQDGKWILEGPHQQYGLSSGGGPYGSDISDYFCQFVLRNKFNEIIKNKAKENIGVNDIQNTTGVDKLAERAKAMEGMSSEQRMAYRVEQLRGTKKPESKPVTKSTLANVTAREVSSRQNNL